VKKEKKAYKRKSKKLFWPVLLIVMVVVFAYNYTVNNKNNEELGKKYKVNAVGKNALVGQVRQRDQIVIPGDALGLFRAGRYEEAIVEFKGMLSSVSDKNLASIDNNIGLCYYRLKDYKNAKEYFSEAITIDEKYEKAYYNMALVYEKQGDMEGSRVWYAKTLKINPENKIAKEKLDAIENLFNTFPNLRSKPKNLLPPLKEKKAKEK